jgi:hypothetical protein
MVADWNVQNLTSVMSIVNGRRVKGREKEQNSQRNVKRSPAAAFATRFLNSRS